MGVIISKHRPCKESVILLHGLTRRAHSLKKIALALRNNGYEVINLSYPSTKYLIEKLATDAISKSLNKCTAGHTIHFVTHSMGGILLRQYLSQNNIKNMGRVVMLAPPNKGSQVVDKLKNIPGFEYFNGPAGMQLGTKDGSIPMTLGAANFEVGIIAGTKSINLISSMILPKVNDGKVSVENTKLEGMKDHICLPVNHPLMMNNTQVVYQVLYFLHQGCFNSSRM